MGVDIGMVAVVVYGLLLTGYLMATSGDGLTRPRTRPRPRRGRTVVIVVGIGVRDNLRINTLQKLQRIPGRKAKGNHMLQNLFAFVPGGIDALLVYLFCFFGDRTAGV